MNILVIDVGGSFVKILATGHREARRFACGKSLTPVHMASEVKRLAKGWKYDVISIGYPGVVTNGNPALEPRNLASGWVGFDYGAAFGCPLKIMNDAAMQALGSYRGGVMLFLGFGTGLGSAMVADHTVLPMELGRLSYRERTYEDYVGLRGLKKFGKDTWREHVAFGISRLLEGLLADEVVLGGGNARLLAGVHPKCRIGDNANAFIGGFRMWEGESLRKSCVMPRYDVPTHGVAGDFELPPKRKSTFTNWPVAERPRSSRAGRSM